MSKHKLIAGNIHDLKNVTDRQAQLWCEIGHLVGHAGLPIDRTSTLDSPFSVSVVDNCRLPAIPTDAQVKYGQQKSYRDICVARAHELLSRQDQMQIPIYLMFSGGIDSTAALVAIFLAARERGINQTEIRERLVVCLNQNSINENPRFYKNHLTGKFRFISSERSLDTLDGRGILIGGEHNDQVFGNYLTQVFEVSLGLQASTVEFSVDHCDGMMQMLGFSNAGKDFWLDRLIKLVRSQTITEVATMRDFLWWVNFNFKWQACYFSLILRAPTRLHSRIDQRFLSQHFDHFFNHPEFQLWSIFNNDKKIRNDWKSYKWPAKDLIFEFDKDDDYRKNKIKGPSLNNILTHSKAEAGMNSEFQFVSLSNPGEYLAH